MDRNQIVCTYALSRVMMYDAVLARRLAEACPCCADLFNMKETELSALLGPYSKYRERILGTDLSAVEKELEQILSRGCTYLPFTHPDFPPLLAECPDAPIGFFIQSSSPAAEIFSRESISIVGSRDISPYGSTWCKNIVSSLAGSQRRPTIVSGMAYGVDITAQATALECGLPTIAVLGTGITNFYPSAHAKYAERIIRTPMSAVISEYPPFADVTAVNFLSRNRIIAGLSRCTVLIESKLKGGGMSTARMAASYNRDVYALPGRNDDVRSQGCNYLIYSHIAQPIIGLDEFFHSLDYKLAAPRRQNLPQRIETFYTGSMDVAKIGMCKRIAALVKDNAGINAEELAPMTGLPLREVTALLLRMENDGFLNIDLLQGCHINNVAKKM